MNTKTITTQILILVTLLAASVATFAQENDLTKQVQVVRPYEPSISDAFKLNLLPIVEDTIKLNPTFNYNLTLRPVSINFPVNNISPARMVAEPLSLANKAYVKVGFGNYLSPLAEVYYASTRQKKYSYGASLKYKGSFGKVKLDNNQKVDGSFNHFNANAFGKRIFKNAALDGGLSFSHFSYGFYGHDTTLAALPIPSEVEAQKQQNFSVGVNFYSTYSDSVHLNYKASTWYNHFADNYSNEQNSVGLQMHFEKFFKMEKVGASLGFTHHNVGQNPSLKSQTTLNLSPWVGLFGSQWRSQVGVLAAINTMDSKTQMHLYPIGFISYDIIANYLIPYFQFSGYLEENHYAKILNENPWATPGLNVVNTSHKFIVKGGLKGNMNPKVAYNISASYELIDSAYFFVNTVDPTNLFLLNKFDVVYDNIQHKHFVGELTIAPTTRIKIALAAEYNIYTMNELPTPWHKPKFIGRANLRYNIKDKILATAEFFVEGKRNVKSIANDLIEIDGLMDVNLCIEYRLNKRASGFLNLNNLTGNRAHQWYLYPTHQFNMMAGITYTF